MKNTILFLSVLFFAVLANAQAELPKSATDISPLLIGEKMPKFTLKNADEVAVKLDDLFSQKRTILVFYRGGWCPYCNLHLAALGESEKELLSLGYQIVAVSPDAPKNLKATDEKQQLNYLLLSDSEGELAKAVGIAFQAPLLAKMKLSNSSDGINKSFMPVPSLFILNEKAAILFEYISPDYKHRISSELLLAVAKSLQ